MLLITPALFIISGLFLGSKHFAYIHYTFGSVPIYITEMAMLIFAVGIGIRSMVVDGASRLPSTSQSLYLLWFGLGILELLRNIDLGIDALRDFALVYYAFFMYIGYYLARNQKYYRFYSGLFLILLLFGVLPRIAGVTMNVDVNLMIYAFLMSWFFVFMGKSHKYKWIMVFCFITLMFWMLTIWVNRSLIVGFVFSLLPCFLYGCRQLKLRAFSFVCVAIVALPVMYSVLSDLQVVGHSGTAAWRVIVWERVFERCLDAPLFGHGLGESAITPEVIPDMARAEDPHNVLLTIFFQMGLFGLLIFGSIVFKFYWDMAKTLKLSNDRSSYWHLLLLTLVATHVTLLVFASTNVALEGPHHGIWFWLVMGIAYGIRGKMIFERQLNRDAARYLGLELAQRKSLTGV